MKEVDCCTSVDGESFTSAIEDGCLYSAKDPTPFQRSLAHIRARDAKIMREGNGNFEEYDETNAGGPN